MSYGPLPQQQAPPVVVVQGSPGYSRPAYGYASPPGGYLLGLIIAIVIIIITIVVIIWLVRAGLAIAGEILANGANRGFPISFIIAIVFAAIVLIITLAIIIWLAGVASRASRAAVAPHVVRM